MEKWNLYDEDRQITTNIIERGQKCPGKLCRLTVHVCIFNEKGEMLIQQRSKTKKSKPNMWDLTLGGCVQAGETSKQAVQRELLEELGVKYDFSDERAYFTINFDNGFDDYYLIEKNISLKKIKFIDEEVQNVKWASEKEILMMLGNGEFIEYYPSLISLLFEMRHGQRGAIR